MTKCKKVSYTKAQAEEQLVYRFRDKGVMGRRYWCSQHSAWHITKKPLITNNQWDKLHKKGVSDATATKRQHTESEES